MFLISHSSRLLVFRVIVFMLLAQTPSLAQASQFVDMLYYNPVHTSIGINNYQNNRLQNKDQAMCGYDQ